MKALIASFISPNLLILNLFIDYRVGTPERRHKDSSEKQSEQSKVF